ncbi:MAG: ribosome maturation factor RimP [Lachnospiraceae bacterium]|jgi:ribosome maturation factor RimP|nr:ribosome maturation factor RimP [Lachnospiraceae bacterium]
MAASNSTKDKSNRAKRDLSYCERTQSLAEPITTSYGLEIYDIDYLKEGSEYYLRIYIDKPGGVTIQDCEKVSKAISPLLDREDFIADSYTFEVSSPGLGRILKKEKHLEKSLGELVEVKRYKPDEQGIKEYSGILHQFDTKTITLMDQAKTIEIPREKIARIRLALVIDRDETVRSAERMEEIGKDE